MGFVRFVFFLSFFFKEDCSYSCYIPSASAKKGERAYRTWTRQGLAHSGEYPESQMSSLWTGHFWEAQTSCGVMNLIWKDSREGKWSEPPGQLSHRDNWVTGTTESPGQRAVAVTSKSAAVEKWSLGLESLPFLNRPPKARVFRLYIRSSCSSLQKNTLRFTKTTSCSWVCPGHCLCWRLGRCCAVVRGEALGEAIRYLGHYLHRRLKLVTWWVSSP